MAKVLVPLIPLSEEQRAEACAGFEIVCSALEDGIFQVQIARTHISLSTTGCNTVSRYREKALCRLTTMTRKDKGTSRRLPKQAIPLIKGLALTH